MNFNREIDGFEVSLRIDGYESPSKHAFGDSWCNCGFSFKFGDVVNYSKEDDEFLTPEEVDIISQGLTELLDGNITEQCTIELTEPYFLFKLYPVKDLRPDSRYSYIAPGCEMQDIYVEWRIYFWNDAPTGNYLTITLDREDITALRDFLNSCITQHI